MIPLALFLLACAAVYVGTVEAAFSALMRLSLRLLAERNGRGGGLSRYLDDPVLLYVPARLLEGLILILATVLASMGVGGASVRTAPLLLAGMAAFALVCQHLLPFLIARRDPERVIEILLPSFEVPARLLRPVTRLVSPVVEGRRDRTGGVPAAGVEEQQEAEAAEGYLEVGEQQGLIERDERRLLQSIFDFGDTLVREVMTPRPDIVAIRSDATLDELRALFREQEYSRIPVYAENLDNIVGIVVVKDLIQLTDVEGSSRPLASLMRPAYFVPETKRVAELLREFQVRQVQLAMAVDEYGGTAGLVTLEDLLEEIVGEIRDEYDVEVEPIVDEGAGAFVFSGKVDIDEVAERLGVEIAREGFETVGGFVLSHVGRVPAAGEAFDIDNLTIQVLEAERRRVTKVRIRRRQAVPEPAHEA
jgi:CBS domain containing-hemolysin-like protein